MVSIWPNTKSEFLSEVVFCFKKRSKALKHKCPSIICDRIIEREDGIENEKIEILVSEVNQSVNIQFHVWDVRWLWISATPCSSSVKLEPWSKEGRASTAGLAQELEQAFEDSLSIAYLPFNDQELEYHRIWNNLIAEGPKAV